MEKIKAAGNTLGGWLLKSFRGLICEKKEGGWELSKGSVMSWLVLYKLAELADAGTLSPELLVYVFGGLMGYNAFKIADVGGAIGKMRK